MRWVAFVILMISIVIVFRYLGDQSIYDLMISKGSNNVQLVNCDLGTAAVDPVQFFNGVCNKQGTILAGMLVILAAASLALRAITGFAAIYLVPLVFLLIFLNFFVFPVGIILGTDSATTIPVDISLTLRLIFNALYVLAIISFVRGNV